MRDDFAVFIMVYGRPENMWTLNTLRDCGYTGKVFFVADDTDKSLPGYRKKYGDDLIVFDKRKAAELYDSGDNTGDLRSTLYSANTIPRLAKERGLRYFAIMCDDYHFINRNFDHQGSYNKSPVSISNLDGIVDSLLSFLECTGAKTIAMAQGGDFIGGAAAGNARPMLLRKAMNTFFCSVDNPIEFVGRLNEDVTTYVRGGNVGDLFFTTTELAIKQKPTQSQSGGLTDAYLDSGTYTKSFFSVMYNPSCVRVSVMGETNRRIHHRVSWNNAVPKIINERHRVGIGRINSLDTGYNVTR